MPATLLAGGSSALRLIRFWAFWLLYGDEGQQLD